jgi:Neuraminidase (sialidase)
MSLITNQGGSVLVNRSGHPSNCGKGSAFTAAVIRSTDSGNTWSQARGIDTQQVASVSIAGQAVRSSDFLPEFAANPVNGNVYAVWQDARFSPTGASKIAFSQSTDGGLSWSPVIRIDQSPGNTQAFLPQIHVASDGTVGLPALSLPLPKGEGEGAPPVDLGALEIL